MNRLSKEGLVQMNRDYFQFLDKEKLVEVAANLHAFAVEQFERLERNSIKSSKPPSSDAPYKKQVAQGDEQTQVNQTPESETEDEDSSKKNLLIDRDAVVVFVSHPRLPPIKNEAERALRHAVIARRISYGTRTSEGSLAYCSLLDLIQTYRLRKVNPWSFIAQVIALGRKGILSPSIPFQVAA